MESVMLLLYVVLVLQFLHTNSFFLYTHPIQRKYSHIHCRPIYESGYDSSSESSDSGDSNEQYKIVEKILAKAVDGEQVKDYPCVDSDRRVNRLISTMYKNLQVNDYEISLWETIRYEATTTADGDWKAATLMANSILSQPSLEIAIIDYLANQLASTSSFQATQIRNLFTDTLRKHENIKSLWALDLISAAIRDVSQPNAVGVLLFNQGYHSLVTYRIANALWLDGRDGLARLFQSLASRTFGADIHPACTIGSGCYLASGTSVIIGETAVIGDNCCIAHGVTLGGTGKESGDRHPKIGNGVIINVGATVLGNIHIGCGCVIDAGSVVTKPVAPFTRVGGVPAKLISTFSFDDEVRSELEVDSNSCVALSNEYARDTQQPSQLLNKVLDYSDDDSSIC